jgi:redox-regulated HSP33 family molecular chaperone
VRGGDLSCEAETGSSSGKLVGDAATWPKTGRLASGSLDEDLHSFFETQHQVKSVLLLDVAVSKGTAILKLLASE